MSPTCRSMCLPLTSPHLQGIGMSQPWATAANNNQLHHSKAQQRQQQRPAAARPGISAPCHMSCTSVMSAKHKPNQIVWLPRVKTQAHLRTRSWAEAMGVRVSRPSCVSTSKSVLKHRPPMAGVGKTWHNRSCDNWQRQQFGQSTVVQ